MMSGEAEELSPLFTCRHCGREIYLETRDGVTQWRHSDRYIAHPAQPLITKEMVKETVPEMARRTAQEQAAAHRAAFLDRYVARFADAGFMHPRASRPLLEEIYEELHG